MNDSKYKIEVAYDGTHYGGWQVQPNSTSIQTLIQNALEVVLRKPTQICGSGRTDAGVHALAQVAHFTTSEEVNTYRLLLSLNSLLPPDIRILSLEKVSDDFHARYSAIGKIYHYHLYLDRVMNPFKRLYCHQVFDKIDVDLMKKAALFFLGTHDFTSFANEAHKGSASHNAVRTLKRLDIIDEPGGLRLELEADGFLYKMVRSIVGTLVDVAAGRIPVDDIPTILLAKDRREAGQAAPPQGLFLVKVLYD